MAHALTTSLPQIYPTYCATAATELASTLDALEPASLNFNDIKALATWVLHMERLRPSDLTYAPSSPHDMLQVLHTELPTTLDAMERASLEFDELGRSLNQLINPLRRLPARQQQRAAAAAADGAKAGTAAGGSSGVALTIGGVGIPLAGLSAVTASGMGAVSGAGQAGGEAMRRLAADLAVLTRVRM